MMAKDGSGIPLEQGRGASGPVCECRRFLARIYLSEVDSQAFCPWHAPCGVPGTKTHRTVHPAEQTWALYEGLLPG